MTLIFPVIKQYTFQDFQWWILVATNLFGQGMTLSGWALFSTTTYLKILTPTCIRWPEQAGLASRAWPSHLCKREMIPRSSVICRIALSCTDMVEDSPIHFGMWHCSGDYVGMGVKDKLLPPSSGNPQFLFHGFLLLHHHHAYTPISWFVRIF